MRLLKCILVSFIVSVWFVDCFDKIPECDDSGIGGAECDAEMDSGSPIDVSDGGTCGAACPPFPPHGQTTCLDGGCVIASCSGGYANCDGLPLSGCETRISTDVNNCGDCNFVCVSPTDATSVACVFGNCMVGSCVPGRGDCDKDFQNGCEVDTLTDAKNCGGCGMACGSYAQTQAECMSGTCTFSCLGEFYDSDGRIANGCETEDAPIGNHLLASAENEGGITSCDESVFTQQIIGYIPSDTRGHLMLPVRQNNTIEDWYVAMPMGEPGCTRSLNAMLITSGGSNTDVCFKLTIFTNQTSYSLQAPGTGMVELGDRPGAYTVPSSVYFKVEKLMTAGCEKPLNENVLYIINYHF